MKKLIIYLYLVIIFGATPFLFLIASTIKLLTFAFDKKGKLNHYFFTLWAMFHLKLLPKCQGVKIIGRENYEIDGKYVLVANHQSQLDILLGFYILIPFRWVSKADVFKVPFIGWAMYLNKYIPLKRGTLNSVKDMIKRCSKSLSEGHSVFLFPEGTRSKNGQVGKFMTGAFTIAKDNKTTILPVVIRNTASLLPSGTLIMEKPVLLELEILKPIPFSSFEDKTVKEISEEVQALIASKV